MKIFLFSVGLKTNTHKNNIFIVPCGYKTKKLKE